jgi:hypothetical protein
MNEDFPLDMIVNQLKTYDETEVCDLLKISSEDLCRRFEDRIKARRKYLEKELEVFPDGEDHEDKDYDHGYQELNFD